MHTIRAHLRRTSAAVARGARRLPARARHLGKEAGQTSVEYMGIVVVAALLVIALISSPLATTVTNLADNAITAIQDSSPSGGGGDGGKDKSKGKDGKGRPNQKPD